MTKPRSIALYGFLGSGNLGNDASMESVLNWLDEQYPDVNVNVITIAPQSVQSRYGLPSVALSASGPWRDGGPVVSRLGKLLGRFLDVPRSLALAGSVDAVLVPGMGVLEENLGVRPWGLPSWLLLTAAACRLRRRPFVLLSVGAETVVDPVTRRLFSWSVDLARHTSCRDVRSARAIRGFGAREPDAIVPDVAFMHAYHPSGVPEPGRVVVGVMAYYGRHDDPVRGANVRRRYVEALADALARLTDEVKIVLVGGDSADCEVIAEVRAAVRARRPGLPDDRVSGSEITTFAQLTDEMARAEVVVASRFHNLICSLRLGRPTISIGYAEKNADLMLEMGLSDFAQNLEEFDADLLVAHVRRAKAEQVELSMQIRRRTQNYSERVSSLLADMAVKILGLGSPSAPRGSAVS